VRVNRRRPNLPQRAIVAIHRPRVPREKRNGRYHWMLSWDGKIYDPSGRYPEGYANWIITSHLEIQ